MNTIIEQWRIPADKWGHDYSFHVTIEPDVDAHPDEVDCYTPEQVEAWRRDEWRYVIVTVTPEFDGVLFPDAAQELNGVEYGQLDGRWVGAGEIEEIHTEDLAGLAAEKADELADKLMKKLSGK